MEVTCERAEAITDDCREILLVAFELGLQSPFNLECLIDRAERGEWGGTWW